MNKIIGSVLFGFLMLLPVKGKTATFGDIWNGLVAEPHASIGESAIPVFMYDSNNGVSRAGAVTSFYKVGPFSFDTGFVTPLDSNQVGTPVLGASVHVDKLISIIIPTVNQQIRSFFPQSASAFMDKLVLGVAPIHNWNTPENQSSLILGFYSGIELRF